MQVNELNVLKEPYKGDRSRYTKQELSAGACVSYKDYSNVLRDFNRVLSRLLIEENVEFKMPLRLRTIKIRKYKKKIRYNEDGTLKKQSMAVNWKATKLMWEEIYPGLTRVELKAIKNKSVVYHLNEHTDGFGFMLYWFKRGSNAINKSVYSVKLTRTNDRYL